MNELYKDVVALFFYASGNSLYFGYIVIYIYLASYLMNFDDSLSIKNTLNITVGFFFGIFVSNFFIPKLFFLIGIKKTMILGAVCFFINMNCFYLLANIYLALLNCIGGGICYQFGILCLNYYLSEKYEKGFIYSSYCFLGQNINMMLVPYLALKVINPENR